VANDVSRVQTAVGFRQLVVVRVTDTADQCFDSSLDQFVAARDRQVLKTPIAVMNQALDIRTLMIQNIIKILKIHCESYGFVATFTSKQTIRPGVKLATR